MKGDHRLANDNNFFIELSFFSVTCSGQIGLADSRGL